MVSRNVTTVKKMIRSVTYRSSQRHRRICRTFFIALAMASGTARATSIDFESIPMGTLYGAAANHSPSEVVLSENGIDMSVENFFLGSFVGFFDAEVGGIYGQQFPTHALQLDNISVQFDLAGVGFAVNQVTFEYLEFGGASNLSVNGSAILQLDSLNDVPSAIAPGISATVGSGVVTLFGPIDRFLVGGQELAIDSITVVPEPATVLLLGVAALAMTGRTLRRKVRA